MLLVDRHVGCELLLAHVVVHLQEIDHVLLRLAEAVRARPRLVEAIF